MIRGTIKASEWDTVAEDITKKACYAITKSHGLYILDVDKLDNGNLLVISSEGSWVLEKPEDEEYHLFRFEDRVK